MKKITFLAASMLIAFGAGAENYFCTPQGNGDMDGSSWENAVPAEDLSSILSGAQSGDNIYMSEGTYKGINVNVVVGITCVGGFPASAKGTDISGYNPLLYKTVFTSEGKNGGDALIMIDGSELKDCPVTTFKGITITGCVGAQNAEDKVRGSALYSKKANTLLQDMVIKDNKSWKGGVVASAGGRFYAQDCVFDGNENARTGVTKNSSNNSVYNAGSDDFSFTVFDRCVFINNSILEGDGSEGKGNRSNACYGGELNFADGKASLVMVNCFADGKGHTIRQNGGFMRSGNGTIGHACVYYFAFNTLYNYDVTHETESKGKVISLNGNGTYFFEGNIIVDKVAGSKVSLDKATGKGVADNKVNLAVWTQGFSANHLDKLESIASGGYNTIGGFLPANLEWTKDDKVYKANFFDVFASDNFSAPAQSDVFAGETTAKDNKYFVLPKAEYKDVNTSEALGFIESYKDDPQFKEAFGWLDAADSKFPKIDLSVDLFGNKRGATTYRGAYDADAVNGGSGISAIAAAENALNINALGNGTYAVSGAEGTIEVYDMSGRKVLSAAAEGETVISLADAPAGIYVARSNGASVKIAK